MPILDRFFNMCSPAEDCFPSKSVFGAMSFDEYSDGGITDNETDDGQDGEGYSIVSDTKEEWSLDDATDTMTVDDTVDTYPPAVRRCQRAAAAAPKKAKKMARTSTGTEIVLVESARHEA